MGVYDFFNVDTESNSTTLLLQQKLLESLGSNVKTKIIDDGNTLIGSDITEEQIIKVKFVSNLASNKEKIFFSNINVTLDNEPDIRKIFGFFELLDARVRRSDIDNALEPQDISYTPFLKNFKSGDNINQLCDKVSSLVGCSPDTFNRVKKYILIFNSVRSTK